LIDVAPPVTCDRLVQIKPNEHIVYYRGDFDSDLQRASEVPEYATVLYRVRTTAIKLELMGRVRLYTSVWELPVNQRVRKRVGSVVTEYCAVGLPETLPEAKAEDGSTAEESERVY
jgi:hypothetical protein